MKKKWDNTKVASKGEWFDEKYKDILEFLKNMPKDTLEKRKERFEWMKKQPKYDAFVIDIMNAWRPEYYNKLKKRLENENYVIAPLVLDEHEDGVASTIWREKDPVVLMEAIRQTIEEYTGVNEKGNTYTILQSVGLKYEQAISKEGAKNDVQKAFVTGTNQNNLYAVLKLVRRVKMICSDKDKNNIEKVLEQCILEDKKSRYTKNEIELAKRMVEGLSLDNFRLDMPLLDDEEAGTWKEQLEDTKNAYEDIEQKEALKALFDAIGRNFDSKWELIVEATGKGDREFLKVFLSRDILIALKLEFVDKEIRKLYKKFLEPECSSWCLKKCPYGKKNNSKKDKTEETSEEHKTKSTSTSSGCYIRYGELLKGSPMGDREIYECLEQMGSSFYKTILNNDYVKYAYIENVQNYYDLFSKKLKPAKGVCTKESFQFTDDIVGKALGRSKSNISKAKGRYEKQTKPLLYKIYKDILEMYEE